MPPPSDHPCLHLQLLDGLFFVHQLKTGDRIPASLLERLQNNEPRNFLSITKTSEEISIAGSQTSATEAYEATWRCIKIAGPMDFGLTGVVCNFTTPLKANGVPVFAVSTWNTDYVLVPKDRANDAVEALKADGWTFQAESA
ncbi:hypothetical protein DENSPDRAFT_372022 [Dentipellis sp. KUC8613]|nr:hypothetical protein DENSPDRAFT_372022 [Dentipellis sp. KUC8613]